MTRLDRFALTLLLFLAVTAPSWAAPTPTSPTHGTGFHPPTGAMTSWLPTVGASSILHGRFDPSPNPFVAGLTGAQFDALFNARYGPCAAVGLASPSVSAVPGACPRYRWKWTGYDNEAKTNTVGPALSWACRTHPELLGITPGTYDCVATPAEIEDCAATSCSIPAIWNASGGTSTGALDPNDPNIVPVNDPSLPCGVFVGSDSFFGGTRTYRNLSLPPKCLGAATAPGTPPTTTPPVTTPPPTTTPPATTPPSTAPGDPTSTLTTCVAWWNAFESWLAGGPALTTLPDVSCRGVRRP